MAFLKQGEQGVLHIDAAGKAKRSRFVVVADQKREVRIGSDRIMSVILVLIGVEFGQQ